MEYENRLPPEGINTTRVHPLKQFFLLATAAVILIVVLVGVLQLSGSFLAKRIPFSFELAIMERLNLPLGSAEVHPEMTVYLNELAAELSGHIPMPEGMSVMVHYSDDDVFNAFATLGGNLLFYKGLLAEMPNENTLAMVIAHEISHVLHRDPVAGIGGGLASGIALLGLTGNNGVGAAGSLLSRTGALTSVQFTRRMEITADEQALAAVEGLYGHVAGASGLFELFQQGRDEPLLKKPLWLDRFASTHPLDEDRIQAVRELADKQQWPQQGELTPLPEGFPGWL